MAYTNANAAVRGDIAALVMEANAEFNELFIGDQIFPVKGEDVRAATYMKAQRANAQLLNGGAKSRAPGTGYNRNQRKFDVDTFDCLEYGEEEAIDDSYAADVDRFMNLEAVTAKLLERKLRISYEQRIATALFNTSVFTATAATAAYTVANIATIDVANDVDLARERMLKNGIIPNTIVMSFSVYQRIRRSTLLQNQIYGVVPRGAGQKMLPGEADVAQALGVEKLLIGKAPKNANAEGQTFSGTFVWPNTYVAVCQIEGGDYTAGGVGRTITWTKDTTGNGLFTPETYREEATRSDILRVRQHVTEKVIDSTACELITTSYS